MQISWTERVKSKEELQRVKEERNTLHKKTERRISGLVTSGVGTAF
jgi:hypothetical protein